MEFCPECGSQTMRAGQSIFCPCCGYNRCDCKECNGIREGDDHELRGHGDYLSIHTGTGN